MRSKSTVAEVQGARSSGRPEKRRWRGRWTRRNVAAAALLVYSSTFLWLTASFAGTKKPPGGVTWTITNIGALASLALFAFASWGMFRSRPWWERTAAAGALAGLAALVPYGIAVSSTGVAGPGLNSAIHIVGSGAVLLVVLVPVLEARMRAWLSGGGPPSDQQRGAPATSNGPTAARRLPSAAQEGVVMTITSRLSGHAVENSIGVAAPAEKVFNYVTDVRREPEWNPQLRQAQKLTPGPVGAGTRYRVRFGRGVGTAIIENTAFDRPRSWAAVSTSRRLDVCFQGQVTEVPGGCRLAVRTELFPHGVLRALSPLLRLLIRRSWEQDLRAIKTIIER